MHQPGLSIFQGAGSLHLNTSAQRLEDEEDLLDQQRRREEVQNRLDNAFGDLSDDNDETNASAASEYSHPPRYPHTLHQPAPNDNAVPTATQHPATNAAHNMFAAAPTQNHNNVVGHTGQTTSPAAAGVAMLPPAYDERNQRLSKFQHQHEIEELKKRLALCESEKQRAFMARQQSHELLVESKGKISEQDDTIQKLKAKLKSVEQTNTDLSTQLECKQTLLNDALIKQQMIERNVGLTSDRHADLAIKQANDRCAAQATVHQQQLATLRQQLDEREHQLKTLQARHTELQRSREALLIEKSETINQLSKSIEDSQRQNQQLMARSDGYEENVRLRSTVQQMSDQIAQLERSLHTANVELTTVHSQIHDSAMAAAASSSSSTISEQSAQPKTPLALRHLANSSTPILNDTNTTTRLRAELVRSMVDQKERRLELQELQRLVGERDAEIETLKTDENRLLVQLESLKTETVRTGTQMRHLQSDLQRLFRMHGQSGEVDINNADQVIDTIQLAYERMSREYDELKSKVGEVANERKGSVDEMDGALRQANVECEALRVKYADLLSIKDSLSNELAAIRTKFDSQSVQLADVERKLADSKDRCLRFESDSKDLRESYEKKLSALGERLASETDRSMIMAEKNKTEIELKQLRHECANYQLEINTLATQLKHSTDTIADLRHSVALKDDYDKLLADLQAKALRFDQFIQQQQQQQQRVVPSNNENCTPERCSSAPSDPTTLTTTAGSPMGSETSRRSADEQRMAVVLAKKLKAIEQTARAQESQLRVSIRQLDVQLASVRGTLEIRDSEVQLLKQAILSERAKTKEIMEQRDVEVGELFEKQQCTLDKYRERLDGAMDAQQRLNERIVELTAERRGLLEARDRLVIECERLKVERDRHDGERAAWSTREQQLRRQVDDLQQSRDTVVEEWEKKYRAAKKTAASYKKYAEDKDLHIARENERIKAEYKRAIEKIQGNVENIVRNN